jgi:hypothetical protein
MLTLADRLIETSIAYRGPKEIRDGFKHVAAKLTSAQRFIVADDVRGAIRSLLTSKPSTLLAAARFARLPFERCWFEWAAPYEANIHPGQIQIKRCGALMEAYGEHGFTMFTAWEFDRRNQDEEIAREVDKMLGALRDSAIAIDRSLMPGFGVSSLVGVYDFSHFIGKPAATIDKRWFKQKPLTFEDLVAQRNDEKNPIRHALKSEEEWNALQKLSESAAFRVHDEVHGAEKINDQYRITGDIGSIVHDVQDEMGHLFATLILMNSKNGVELTETKPDEKLNKARSKQGKSKLLPYSTVRIKLTNSQQRAVNEGRITRAEARRHPVRGHFKVRATGVFWWNEAWRGNALRGVVERRAHLIDAAHPITPAPEEA